MTYTTHPPNLILRKRHGESCLNYAQLHNLCKRERRKPASLHPKTGLSLVEVPDREGSSYNKILLNVVLFYISICSQKFQFLEAWKLQLFFFSRKIRSNVATLSVAMCRCSRAPWDKTHGECHAVAPCWNNIQASRFAWIEIKIIQKWHEKRVKSKSLSSLINLLGARAPRDSNLSHVTQV